MVEKEVGDGISRAIRQYVKIDNRYVEDYDENK